MNMVVLWKAFEIHGGGMKLPFTYLCTFILLCYSAQTKWSGEMLALVQLIASGALFPPDIVASHCQVLIWSPATIHTSDICGVITSIDLSNLKLCGTQVNQLRICNYMIVSSLCLQVTCCN